MKYRHIFALFALLLAVAGTTSAAAPNFSPVIYADGEVWGTKGLSELPAPNGHNNKSFDKLFMFVNGAPGQMPVSEAGPGNPAYNGGRWNAQTVMWTQEAIDAYGGEDNLPVLMSYGDIHYHHMSEDLAIAAGHAAGGPDYFLCPLLPVK
jgi:hypothetical protein